jgi:adenylyltransferase/sulfurtransferase
MPDSDAPTQLPTDLARYSRQILVEGIGIDGQQRIKHAAVTLIGCGALGSVLANTLVRAGIGYLRIIDRDFIELNNLQRQVLYDEHDIAENLPKAEAAARKLRKANSAVEIDAIVADLNPSNAESLCGEADLLLDGTDNLETRFLINDLAVKREVPWVYGACLATDGLVLPVLPGRSPCLRCIWDEPPPPGEVPTCDTAGILAGTVNVVASLQAIEAIKILAGRESELMAGLATIDVWTGRVRTVNVQSAFEAGACPCCHERRFEFLSGERAASSTTLCGRDAVQLLPSEPSEVNLKSIAGRLPAHTRPRYNEFLLRFKTDDHAVTLFRDGRVIVQGTSDSAVARSVVAKYVGT